MALAYLLIDIYSFIPRHSLSPSLCIIIPLSLLFWRREATSLHFSICLVGLVRCWDGRRGECGLRSTIPLPCHFFSLVACSVMLLCLIVTSYQLLHLSLLPSFSNTLYHSLLYPIHLFIFFTSLSFTCFSLSISRQLLLLRLQ